MPFALPADISEHDADLIVEALLYALVTIEQLPPNRHEWSDAEAMRTLLDRIVPDSARVEDMLGEVRSLVTGDGAS